MLRAILAGVIILSLLAATGGSRKAIKQDAQKVLDRFWEIDIGDQEWTEYWREVSK